MSFEPMATNFILYLYGGEGVGVGGGGGGGGVEGLELEIMTRVHLLKVELCLNRRECPKINAIVNCAGK
jgi:hypothetical protein